MTETPELIVRPAVVADLEEMAKIRRCPEVQKNQYWLVEAFWLDYSESVIMAQASGTTYYYVLQVSDTVVGFVNLQSIMRKELKYGYFSFNLHPDFWGQGLMERALRTIFAEFFQVEENRGAMIECFSGNHQCQRLLAKLCFVSVPIPFATRLSMWISHQPLRWVLRFWLSKESWAKLT
jgi:RimJ/RimL family protein N-acetyltransferase